LHSRHAAPGSRIGITALSFSIPLASIPPGEYDCQISVLDPGMSSFWQAPIKIVP
jgi:hypothetical protein